jgi:hypothetical protein
MGKRIYCSLPAAMQGRDHLIDDIKIKLIHLNGDLDAHNRVSFSVWREGSKYSDDLVRDADVFMFWHPDNKFDFNLDSLPHGVKKEFNLAHSLNKKILLIYRTKDNELGFYDVKLVFGQLRGVPGSSRGLYSYITKKVGNVGKQPTEEYKCKEEEVCKTQTFDKRLLLTIK